MKPATGSLVNRLRMTGGYLVGRALEQAYPQEVVIELTNHCNLACVMCPHKTMTRPRGFMEQGLFRKIVDEIRGRTELVYLYGTGESLLHRELHEYVAYARNQGLTTCLSTNGMLMDEAAADRLLQCGLDFLVVALDGGTKATYESIRVKGDFDVLMHNIRTLLRRKRELDSATSICLQMIFMPENAAERELFLSQFSPQERAAVDAFRFKPLYETYALRRATVRNGRPCFWLWNMLSVYWNGDVALCCMDSNGAYRLGNLVADSVAEVWASARFQELRSRHKQRARGAMPLCAACDIPEQGYFNWATIAGATLVHARTVRRVLPWYERNLVLPLRRLGARSGQVGT